MPAQFDIVQQHDDRLSKLEENVSDMRSDIAGLTVQVGDGFQTLQESLGRLATKIDAINDVNNRLAVIETKQASAAKGLKFLSGLVTVAFGAVLAFLGLR